MEKDGTIDVEPTDEQLVEAFNEELKQLPDDEVEKGMAIMFVKRAWVDGRISKKTAFSYIMAGHIRDELEELLEA